MDIKITDKSLRYFLKTTLLPEDIANRISLCGPTFDRIHKQKEGTVYEIEVITNRVDTASAQGVAREAAAILRQQNIKVDYVNDPYREKIHLYPNLPQTLPIKIISKDLCPRFTAVALENISIKESDQETQDLLKLSGERPINNAVDITNELTLLYGMPSHIFDLDKLGQQQLQIRTGKNGEVVTTLDGQNNILNDGDIIIEDGTGRLIDLCGIMGGSIAEVDQYTKNILLIVPTYNPTHIRKTSLRLQKRTLASQIYEKEPDPELCLPVLTKAIQLFQERTGAVVSSAIFNSNPEEFKSKSVNLNLNWLKELIGVDIPYESIKSILTDLGFQVSARDQDILCSIPSWRDKDIYIPEDIVEEVARIYGYYKLPAVIPNVHLQPEPKNPTLDTELKIKQFLSNTGFNEVYNSSLISADQITNSYLNLDDHLKLNNPLSYDYEYLRTSLVPSALQNIKNNQGKTEEPFNLYEISNTYFKTAEKLPLEKSSLVIASTDCFRNIKGVLEALLDSINLKSVDFSPTPTAHPNYFLISHTAKVVIENTQVGFIGKINPEILHNLKITSDPTITEINIDTLSPFIKKNFVYTPLPEYPAILETITISSNLPVGEVIKRLYKSSKLIGDIHFIETYKSNLSFKISFISPSKNLTQEEVNQEKTKIFNLFS